MLQMAVVFFVIAIIAAVFGFGGIAAGAVLDRLSHYPRDAPRATLATLPPGKSSAHRPLLIRQADETSVGSSPRRAPRLCPRLRLHYHLWSLLVSSSGLNLSAIASRALKMRDLTVPMGQFMIVAISS